MLYFVTGATGFIGRHVVQRLARQGWRIRVATRRPDRVLFLKPLGNVGQIVPMPVAPVAPCIPAMPVAPVAP